MYHKKYSQFPVYDAEGQYRQLLTENGITSWLASQAVQKSSPPQLEVVAVETLLRQQEARENCHFVSCETSVPQAVNRFNQTPYLEALLITEHGGQEEPLLGIVTPWDLLQADGKRN
jgi:hypothetical protein